MKNPTSNTLTETRILKGAVIAGIINGSINGAIQLFLLQGKAPIALTVNSITNDTTTVLGEAVPLAVTLAMILTVIGYLTLKQAKRPFWPDVVWLTIKHGMFAFGVVVSGAILWQRVMGSVSVSLIGATLVMSVIAGLVAATANYMTIHASRLPLGQPVRATA